MFSSNGLSAMTLVALLFLIGVVVLQSFELSYYSAPLSLTLHAVGNRQPPVQQAPPAQKLRLRYAKRGPARFTSHRDFGRALERALRRAEIPMAYSSGFSPHPRISYANAAPTTRIRDVIKDRIESVVWRNKLAAGTIGVAAGHGKRIDASVSAD